MKEKKGHKIKQEDGQVIETTPITEAELESKLDAIFNYNHKKFQDLRQRHYESIEVYNKYVILMRPLVAFDAMYEEYKKKEKEKKEGENNG